MQQQMETSNTMQTHKNTHWTWWPRKMTNTLRGSNFDQGLSVDRVAHATGESSLFLLSLP